MAYKLPDGFPDKLSDEDLAQAVEDLRTALLERYSDDVGTWLPELQLALITTALTEQSRRQLRTGSLIALASLVVAGAALLVAIITLLVA